MIKVLEIIAIKNNKYKIILSQKEVEESIIVPESALVRANLFSPRVISLTEYKQITKMFDEDILYEKALHFIDYQMRSISEVKKYLKKATDEEELILNIVARLKQNQYLDDDRYVKTYIAEKIDFDLVGPAYIKQKLILKGIHYDLIDQNLVRFTDEMQYDKIYELIQKATKYPIKNPLKKALASMKSKLVKKGFHIRIVESSLLSHVDLLKNVIDEKKLILKEIQDIKKRNKLETWVEKDQAIQKLYRKGYDYELIKTLLKG